MSSGKCGELRTVCSMLPDGIHLPPAFKLIGMYMLLPSDF